MVLQTGTLYPTKIKKKQFGNLGEKLKNPNDLITCSAHHFHHILIIHHNLLIRLSVNVSNRKTYITTTVKIVSPCITVTSVRLQNLPWYKTGFVSRQVLHLLSKLQNWICPKTGQYKTCIVSNTKIEASIRATKPKPWQSHLTSETVEIFIQRYRFYFSLVTTPAITTRLRREGTMDGK